MSSSKPNIRIGYVPEHYLTPLHLCVRHPSYKNLPFELSLIPFPSGTGHMITSLRADEIDIGIGLTEGWIAGLTGKQQLNENNAAGGGGYKIVGQWVETPLRWAIVTGKERADLNGVDSLKDSRVGVSRLGSGSHIMSFVLSQQQGWSAESLKPVILGPFAALREGVLGHAAGSQKGAEFFMWEHFTTKPYFQPSDPSTNPSPPLKKIGEIYTPWPSWHIVASTKTFPSPEEDETLKTLFSLFDTGIAEFESKTNEVVGLLGTGELGCTYTEDDAREWLKATRFVKNTRGLDRKVVEKTVDVLKVAGVIDQRLPEEEAVQRVTGIPR
ncbi:hypothetical protein BGW36DRAFT_372242 [Talaromyces proteolyticus]|uniref:Ca3427-like PBP 2 domain-containing protein n=1 Tax=Talaromyces proteolyticus TaxID=1131652 RepID=A0AAD4KYZ0_9EURO|nr:uncharacterized protein BGW36DRAFT_372242 [Talaromyces proteolyticus]KAH8702122.1 hypothetical protein BGW36DRAFT_372242 [Talaromyces proteolyticus]